MVAIVAGNGLGLLNGSAINVGSAGTFGQGSLGQAGSATVNLSTGNLLLQFNDEQITGTGSDLLASRTYNALGGVTDGDGDRWRWSGEKKVVQSGSNVIRTTGDGHEAVYTWNGSAYVSNTGSGAHDKITKVGSEWIWEEGSSKTVERYNTSTGWIKNVRDTSGNGFDYTFSGSKLTKVRDIGSGQELQFVYGSNGKVSQLKTRTEYAGSIKTLQQVYYTYDSYNRLSVVKVDLTPDNNSISDNKIFSTTYGYDGSSTRVTSVSHNDGTSANITYTYHGGAYKVRTVTDASGTTTFTYGTNQTTVSNGTGDAWVYSYDSNKQLTSVTSALVDGVTQKVSYTYYNGEVKTVTDGFNKTVTYVYDSNGNRTSETDTQGNTVTRLFSNNLLVNESRSIDGVTQTDRFVYDSARRLRYTVSGEGRVSENRYDVNGNVTSSREYTGTAASYAYQVINLGGDKTPTDLGTYDIDETWEMTVNINGTSRFIDQGSINPGMTYHGFIDAINVKLSPYGARMAMVGGNLIIRTTAESSSASISITGGTGYFSSYVAGYEGLDTPVQGRSSLSGLYSVSGLSSTTTLSETQLNSWVNGQVKSAVQLTDYAYDHLGRLTQKTDYAEVNNAGAGLLNHGAGVTAYVYSEYGQLLNTIAKRGSGHNVSTTLSSVVYDGMGRQISMVSAAGTETTSYGYRAITTSSNTSGLSVTQSFDSRGRVDYVTSSASGQSNRVTDYTYDDAGRVIRTDDAAGGSRYVYYNNAGQVLYKVDSQNRAVGFTYNQNGQVIKEVQHYNTFNHTSESVSLNSTYDVETRYGYNSSGLLETITKENGGSDIVVTTAYDSAAQKIKETQGSRVTRYFYDKDGLLKGVLNAEGFLSENIYDGVGRNIRTVRYETEVTGSTFTSGTFASVRGVADNGAEQFTYYYYDGQGRQVGMLDEQGFLTETLFEPALSQTHTLKYLTPITVSIYDSFLDVKLKAGVGKQVSTHTHFDAYGRVSKVVSADGTETQSIYDSAGRLARTVEKVATKRIQTTGVTFEDAANSSWSISRYWAVDQNGTSSGGTGPSIGADGSQNYIYMETSSGQAYTAGNAGHFESDFISTNGSDSLTFDYHMYGSNMGTLVVDAYVEDADRRGVEHGYQTINLGGGISGDDIVFDKLDDSFDFIVYVNGVAQQVSITAYEDEVHTYNSLIGLINQDLTGASAAIVDGNIRIASHKTGTSSTISLSNFGAYDADLRSELDGYQGIDAAVSGSSGIYSEYETRITLWSLSGQQQSSNTDAWKSATIDLSQFEGDIKLRFRGIAAGGYMGDMAVDNIAVHSSIFEERVTHNQYNAFGELTGVVGGEGSEGLASSPSSAALNTAITNYGQRFSYDGMGRKISEAGPDGQKTLFFYDKSGRLTYTVNALGEATQTIYNGLGQVKETRVLTNRISTSGLVGGSEASTLTTRVNSAKNDTTDNVVKQTYNKLGLQHITTDAQNFTTTKTYNGYGDLYSTIRKINSGSNSTAYHYYDLLGRQTQTSSHGVISQTRYDAFGRVSGVRDGNGNWTNTTYKFGGREVVVSDAANKTNITTYDAFGRTLTSKDAQGAITTYQYDEKQNAVTVTTPSGTSITSWSNADGDTLQLRDGNGYVTYYNYNKDGQLESVKDHNRNTISQKIYDDSGRLKDVIDGNGNVTRFSYDMANRTVKEEIDPDGVLMLYTNYVFDGQGRQLTVIKGGYYGYDRITEYKYYADGQVKQIIVDPTGLNLSTQFTYDGLGSSLTVSQGTVGSPSQRTTLYTYDLLGRKTTERVDPYGKNITTQYKYDSNGNLTRMINASGYSSWFVYNNLNQKVAEMNAEGGVTKYGYDNNGRLHFTHSYSGRVASSTVDAWGDVVSSVSMGDNDTYDRRSYNLYNGDGRVLYVVTAQNKDAWMVNKFQYDGNGNVVALVQYDKTISNETIVDATHLSGRLSEGWVNIGLSRIDRAGTNLGESRITRYEYDALNRQVKTTLAGYYDAGDGRVWASASSDRFARTIEVTYDKAGNEVRNKIRIGLSEYAYQYKTYDAANRMVHDIDAEKGVTKNTYDSLGNITQVTRYNNTVDAEPYRGYFLATDTVVSSVSPYDRVIVNQYDVAGRKISTTMPSSIYSMHLSPDGKSLIANAAVTQFEYNAMGEKVKESVQTYSSTWRNTYYYYDGAGRQTMMVNAKGQATKTEYDGMGNTTRTVQLYEVVTPSELNTSSAPTISENESLDRVTRFTYNNVGQNTHIFKDNATYTSSQEAAATSDRDELEVKYMAYNAFGDIRFQRDAAGASSYNYFNRDGQNWFSYSNSVRVAQDNENPFGETDTKVATAETLYLYNAFGELAQQEQKDHSGTSTTRTTSIEYDYAGNAISSTDAEGNIHTQEFDVAGHVIAEQTVVGNGTVRKEFTYDKTGRQTSALDVFTLNGAEHKTGKRSAYNTFGDVTHEYTVSGAGGSSSQLNASYDYDRTGLLYRQRDSQYFSNFYYDLDGALIRKSQLGSTTYYERDELGRVTKETKPYFSGLVDATANQTLTSLTPVTTQEYDRWGNIWKSTVSEHNGKVASRVTEYLYDHNDRIISEILPSVSRTTEGGSKGFVKLHRRYNYDEAGRLVRQTEGVNGAETNVRRQYYDAHGNVAQEIDASGIITQHRYNAFGERVGTRDGVNNVRVFRYDGLGQRTAISAYRNSAYRTGYLNQYEYDAVGRRTNEITYFDSANGRSVSVEYIFDERGRKLQTIDQGGRSTYYTYDSQGNKTEERFSIDSTLDSITKWTYNTAVSYKTGQMDSKTGAGGRLTNYDYDSYSRLTTELYNGSASTQRTYTYVRGTMLQLNVSDRNNVSKSDGYENSTRTSNYSYDLLGNRVRELIEDVNDWKYETYVDNGDNDTDSVDTYYYTEYSKSRVDTRSLYDAHNRLIKVTSPDVAGNENVWDERASLTSLEYSYDAFGNRRKVRAVYQRPNSDANSTDIGWYRYDGEGRALVANGEYNNDTGEIEAIGGKSYAYQYDTAGRVSNEYQWTKAGISSTEMPLNQFNDYLLNRWGGNVHSQAAQSHFGGEVISYEPDTRSGTIDHSNGTATYYYEVMVVEVDKGEQYTQRTYSYDTLGHRTASNKKTVRIRDGVQVYAGSSTADFRAEYDSRGLKKSHTAYDDAGQLKSRTTSSYSDDGKLSRQYNYDKDNRLSGDTSYSGGYDGAGNVVKYIYNHWDQGVHKFKYTYTQDYVFVNGENYLQKNAKVERSNGGWTPGNSNFKYDVRGNLSSVSLSGGEFGSKSFIYDNDGKILAKSETVDGKTTKDTYFYQSGNRLGSVGNRTVDLMPSVQMAGGAAPRSHTVSGGETLHGLAQSFYGDSSLWYLIADANGLALGPGEQFKSGDSGMLLEIPSVDASLQNKADNFKPYNPGEIIGDTTPSPQAPPPPSSSCNALLTVVMVVVAVIVTVYTAGAAAGLMANAGAIAAGGTTATAAMGAGMASGALLAAGGNTAILMAASAIGGFAGSVASQAIGVVGGAQDNIDFGQAFTEGAVSGLTAGIGKGFAAATNKVSFAGSNTLFKAGKVAANYVASTAVKQIAGMDVGFSWKGMAANVAGSMVAGSMVGGDGGDGILSQTANAFASSSITARLSEQWGVGPEADYGQIALTAFGSALANDLVRRMGSPSTSNIEKKDKVKADAAKQDAAAAIVMATKANDGGAAASKGATTSGGAVAVHAASSNTYKHGGEQRTLEEMVITYNPKSETSSVSFLGKNLVNWVWNGNFEEGTVYGNKHYLKRNDAMAAREYAAANEATYRRFAEWGHHVQRGNYGPDAVVALGDVGNALMSEIGVLGDAKRAVQDFAVGLDKYGPVGHFYGAQMYIGAELFMPTTVFDVALMGAGGAGKAAQVVGKGVKSAGKFLGRVPNRGIGDVTNPNFIGPRNTVDWFRVDDAAFAPRVTSEGVPLVLTKKGKGPERALFVNVNQPHRAKEFFEVNRSGNATVTTGQMDASLLHDLRASAVHDLSDAAKLNPTAPLKVDFPTPDQFGLRTPEQIQAFRDAIVPGSVRVIDPNKL